MWYKYKLTLIFLFCFFGTFSLLAQVKSFESLRGEIIITGTSPLHDWSLKSDYVFSRADLKIDEKNRVIDVEDIGFGMNVTSLKGYDPIMDENCYKALKSHLYPTIKFEATQGKCTPVVGNQSKIEVRGKMTIAGITRMQRIIAVCTYNPENKEVRIVGSTPLEMSDYGVNPPGFFDGMYTVGDRINVRFDYTFKSSQ